MSTLPLKHDVIIKFQLVHSPGSVGMDLPTVLLIYKSVRYDFKRLFSIRRLFCLGLFTGFSIMTGLSNIFERINPEKLPLDIIDEDFEEFKMFYKIQLQNFEKKVRHLQSQIRICVLSGTK